MDMTFLLDTCVISETSKVRPRVEIASFLSTVKNVAMPAGALMELQLGITQICATDPIRAVKLSRWYQGLLKKNIPIIESDLQVVELWGVLAADKRLQNHFIPRTDGKQRRHRGGQDVHIAAAALAHRLPIATMNVSDFMRIHECYPLPGIYNPATGVWHARMQPLTFPSLSSATEDDPQTV